MMDAGGRRLRKWVAQARSKFGLPAETTVYWRGYAACLDDVERLAAEWEAEGT